MTGAAAAAVAKKENVAAWREGWLSAFNPLKDLLFYPAAATTPPARAPAHSRVQGMGLDPPGAQQGHVKTLSKSPTKERPSPYSARRARRVLSDISNAGGVGVCGGALTGDTSRLWRRSSPDTASSGPSSPAVHQVGEVAAAAAAVAVRRAAPTQGPPDAGKVQAGPAAAVAAVAASHGSRRQRDAQIAHLMVLKDELQLMLEYLVRALEILAHPSPSAALTHMSTCSQDKTGVQHSCSKNGAAGGMSSRDVGLLRGEVSVQDASGSWQEPKPAAMVVVRRSIEEKEGVGVAPPDASRRREKEAELLQLRQQLTALNQQARHERRRAQVRDANRAWGVGSPGEPAAAPAIATATAVAAGDDVAPGFHTHSTGSCSGCWERKQTGRADGAGVAHRVRYRATANQLSILASGASPCD